MCDLNHNITGKSQRVKQLLEWVVFASIGLLVVTALATFEYARQLRKARREYERSKMLVEDIVLSFNRELRRTSERLELVGYKIEGNAGKLESALKKTGEVEKRMSTIETQVDEIQKPDQTPPAMFADLTARVSAFEEGQRKLREQLSAVTSQVEKLSVTPEIRAEQVIPIRRDKALATLTDTEISVLETLSAEGPKTSPEIKDSVKLSREHTARVMKKLYEEGYVERETGKIPFKYSIKKEMEQLLKKPEASQS